jgi:hypothetical protein
VSIYAPRGLIKDRVSTNHNNRTGECQNIMNGLHPDILKDVLQGQWRKFRDTHLEDDKTKGFGKKRQEPLYDGDETKTSHILHSFAHLSKD